MQKQLLTLLFLFSLYGTLTAQNPPSRHSILFSLGQGYEDGLIRVTRIPTIGLGYEYRINRFFDASIYGFTYYRDYADFITAGSQSNLLNSVFPGNQSAFFTQEQLDAIQDVGIKNVNPGGSINLFSVPISMGITFYPLQFRRSRLGMFVGGCAMYETFNLGSENAIFNVTLNDGTVYELANVVKQAEFRHWSFGDALRLRYDLSLKNTSFGLQFGANNYYFSANNSSIVWQFAAYAKFRI
jgi:hypothetical protein